MLLYYNILCYRSQSDVTSLPLIANPLMLLALRKEMEMLTMIMMMMLTTTMMMMLTMMRMVKCTIVSWASADSIPGKLPWVNKQNQPPQAFYEFSQKQETETSAGQK